MYKNILLPFTQNNKYLKWYMSIIDKALSESRFKNKVVYYELHHILPKSIFPEFKTDKTYMVFLTAREHYIVHLLLCRLFIHKSHTIKMKNAMIRFIKGNIAPYSRCYSLAKAAAIQRNKERTISNSQKEKMSKRMSGKNNPFYGKKHTKESIEKIILANENTKNIRSEKLSGKNNPMYGRTGILSPRFGVKLSDEIKNKISVANKNRLCGENNPAKRQDVRDKISAANRERNLLKSPGTWKTPNGDFLILSDAAKINGLNPGKIKTLCLSNKNGYNFVPK